MSRRKGRREEADEEQAITLLRGRGIVVAEEGCLGKEEKRGAVCAKEDAFEGRGWWSQDWWGLG